MLEPVLSNPWVRAVGVLAGVLITLFLMYLLSPILVPLFFAFLVAYVFDPVVDMLERRKISRTASIAGLGVVGIGIVVAIPLFMVPSVIQQADQLAEAARARLEDGAGEGFLTSLTDRLPLRTLVEALDLVDPESENYDPDYDPVAKLTLFAADWVRTQGVEMLQGQAGAVAAAGQSGASRVAGFFSLVGRGAMNVFLFIGNVALFSVVAVYLLKDYDTITATARELLPLKYKDRVIRIFDKINDQVRGFLRGQMLVCLCLGIMYAIGLSLSGVPFAIPLAIFGAVASFIPYLGLALTIGPAMLLCVMQYGGIDLHLAGVIATFVVAQMLEGTVLTPKIVGDQVGLGPVWVILAVMVFGNALGFLGLLLAVPIAASLKVLVVEAVHYYRNSPVYTET